MSLFSEDVLDMLDEYDINTIDEKDIDELIESYNDLRKNLDMELTSCVDKRLISKVNRCIAKNKKLVSTYIY